MLSFLLLVTLVVALLSVTGVGIVSSTVLFLLNYPPFLAIIVLAICVLAPSSDGHVCERFDESGRLLPCYPGTSVEKSKYGGRMCRASERRRELRRLWRDVMYFATKFGRAVWTGASVVFILVWELYQCLRGGVIWLSPIVVSTTTPIVYALYASSFARSVAIWVSVSCMVTYLLAPMVAGLLLAEYDTPNWDCVFGCLTPVVGGMWMFRKWMWKAAKASGLVSTFLARIREDINTHEASMRGDTQGSKQGRRIRSQPQADGDKNQATTTRRPQTSDVVDAPLSQPPTGNGDPTPNAISQPAPTLNNKACRAKGHVSIVSATVVGSTDKITTKKSKRALKATPGPVLAAPATEVQNLRTETAGSATKDKLVASTSTHNTRVLNEKDKPMPASEKSRTNKMSIPAHTAKVISTPKAKGSLERKMGKAMLKAADQKKEETAVDTKLALKTIPTAVGYNSRDVAAECEKASLPRPKVVAPQAKTTKAPDATNSSTSAAPASDVASQAEPNMAATNNIPSAVQKAQASNEHPGTSVVAAVEPSPETHATTAAASMAATVLPAPSDLPTTTGGAGALATPPNAPAETEQSIQSCQTSPERKRTLKSPSHVTSSRAMRMYAPVPHFQVQDTALTTRAARAELKKKHAAKKAKLGRRSMRVAAVSTGASVAAAVQPQPVDVPETAAPPVPAGMAYPAMEECQQPATAPGGTTAILSASNNGPASVNQPPPADPSPYSYSPMVESPAPVPPTVPHPPFSPTAPTPQKVAATPKQPAAASHVPLSIPCKPVNGASFFKSYKPAPRPAPSPIPAKSSPRTPLPVATQPTSASTAGPSVAQTPMELELLVAYEESFGAGRSSMRTESDLDLGLAAAPAAPGACRQLGRVEAKKVVAKKNVVYTTDAQGKKRVVAGEVRKEEYVYKWNLDLGTPGVRMRAPKELWEGN